MADEQSKVDILINTASAASNIRELRKALMQLKSAQEDVDKSSPEFGKLIEGINETESRIGDLNDAFKTFAGSGMERLNSSTYMLKDGFDNLDLDKIGIAFQGFSQLPKAMAGELGKLTKLVNGLNFKSLGDGMKTLSKSGVGELTKSIIQLGKAILTNPILLLAAVIIALVIVVVKFYDKIKVLRIAVEAIGKAFEYVIQKLKDFADWLGITDFAGEKAAENQIANAKKVGDATTRRYDREISIASAAGKETIYLEKLKEFEARKSIRSQIDGLEKLRKVNGKLTNEQKAQLDELIIAKEDSEAKSAALDATGNKKKVDESKATAELLRGIENDNEDLRIKLIKAGEKRQIAELKASKDKKKKELQALKEKYKDNVSIVGKLNNELLLLEQNFQNDKTKIQNEWESKRKQESINVVKDLTDYQKTKLLENKDATIGQLDIIHNKEKEIFEKEMALALEKDKENASLYKSEEDRINAFNTKKSLDFNKLNDKQLSENKQILDKQNADYQAGLEVDKLAAEEAYENIKDIEVDKKRKAGEKVIAESIKSLTYKKSIELNNVNLTENEKALIIQKYEKLIGDTKKKYHQEDIDRTKEATAKKLNEWAAYTDMVTNSLNQLSSVGEQASKNELDNYNNAKNEELSTLQYNTDVAMQQYEDEAAAGSITAEELAKKKSDLANKTAMEEYKIKLDQFNFNKKMKHEEFVRNKKMQLASAIMDTASAVMRSIATYPPITPAGIASLVAIGIASAANIAKIASTQEDTSGEAPKPPIMAAPSSSSSGFSSSGSGSGSNFLAPQFFGLGQGVSQQNTPQKVYILESEITAMQLKMNKVQVRNTQSI